MSTNFWRVCKANFLLFISVYLLFPAFIVELTDRFNILITQAATVYLVLIAGRIVAGPFVNYFVDSFRRKYVCTTAWIIVLLSIALLLVSKDFNQVLILAFLLGLSFGVVSSASIVLATDLSTSENRNRANVIFGWFTRLGMIFGIAVGGFIYLNKGFSFVIYASLLAGLVGIIYLLLVRVPFRAPIGVSILSLDRFFLPRSFLLVINLMLIAFVPGIFIPLIHFDVCNTLTVHGISFPYFVFVSVGFIMAIPFSRSITSRKLSAGFVILLISVCLVILLGNTAGRILSAALMGVALAFITPAMLSQFIGMSSHCERVSANTTNLLSWGTGLVAGIFTSCYLKDTYSSLIAYQAAMFSAALAFVMFITLTFPYYKKRKVR